MTNPGRAPDKLTIWRISDSRAGHDSQSKGLVNALAALASCDCYDLPAMPFSRTFAGLLLKQFSTGKDLPDPDLIVGAGHGTHMSMLCARRARGGKTIVLMRPSLPAFCFDLCLIPAHDRPTAGNNIIITSGALNNITPSQQLDPGAGLMLVGGPSRHYNWNNQSLLDQIAAIVKQELINWTITDSPRTPDLTRRSLAELGGNNVRFVSYPNTPAGWLDEHLQTAGKTWVSEDSISMIYEALTAGGSVGLLNIPIKQTSRVTRAVKQLSEQAMVTGFSDWQSGKGLGKNKPVLHESSRCAKLILGRYFPGLMYG